MCLRRHRAPAFRITIRYPTNSSVHASTNGSVQPRRPPRAATAPTAGRAPPARANAITSRPGRREREHALFDAHRTGGRGRPTAAHQQFGADRRGRRAAQGFCRGTDRAPSSQSCSSPAITSLVGDDALAASQLRPMEARRGRAPRMALGRHRAPVRRTGSGWRAPRRCRAARRARRAERDQRRRSRQDADAGIDDHRHLRVRG